MSFSLLLALTSASRLPVLHLLTGSRCQLPRKLYLDHTWVGEGHRFIKVSIRWPCRLPQDKIMISLCYR